MNEDEQQKVDEVPQNQETELHDSKPEQQGSLEHPGEQKDVLDNDNETAVDETASIKQSKKLGKRQLFIIGGGLVFLIILGLVGYLVFGKKDQNKNTTPVPAVIEQKKEIKEEPKKVEKKLDPILAKFITPTTGEVWLSTPKKIASLGYLQYEDPNVTGTDVIYYEVGSRGQKTIVMTIQQAIGDVVYLFEKSTDGKAAYLARLDSEAVYNAEDEKYLSDSFTSKVAIDKETHYDSLSLPNSFDLGNGYAAKKPTSFYLGDSLLNNNQDSGSGKFVEVKQYGGSTLQKFEQSYPDTNLTSIGYAVTLPTNSQVTLEYQPLDTDLKNFKWSVGESYVDDSLSAISRGCGNRFTSVTRADKVKDSDFKEAGKSNSGQIIYEVASPTNPLLVKAYEEFVEFYKDIGTENTEYAQYKNMTKEDFVKKHALVFHKDKDGQWLAFTRGKLRPIAGCAKPVVYLYPTYAQNVSVRVGADVKISEPAYDSLAGWDVWADPSGLLNVAGNDYGSLFWEGPGIGRYPEVNKGVIVSTTDVIATIRGQLANQGLNQKEIDDFVEYWQPNLPSKPYTRLSWLNTAELNELAPLGIKPRPDTVIRVFLDFAGLDEPYTIVPQQFSPLPRKGFTVIEWGGLSTKKLY